MMMMMMILFVVAAVYKKHYYEHAQVHLQILQNTGTIMTVVSVVFGAPVGGVFMAIVVRRAQRFRAETARGEPIRGRRTPEQSTQLICPDVRTIIRQQLCK